MNIVIIGGGKVGSKLASQLVAENHDVTVIDNDPEALDALGNVEDVLCVCGSAINHETQDAANLPSADIVIACTNSDEVNMLSCLIAKKRGTKSTIARVRNPEYIEQIQYIKKDLGLSMYINPEESAARAISRVLLFPAADSVETFSRGKTELVEFKLEKGNSLIGYSLAEIGQKYKAKFLICAIARGEKVFIPTGRDVLKEDDSIYVTASHSQMVNFFKKMDEFRTRVKSVIISGGGKIAYYLAEKLLAYGMVVKIIEKNSARCDELAEKLSGALIVHADGTNEEVLCEEGIGSADAFVALTGLDEVNIISSVFAKNKGVEKVVTKINQFTFTDIIKKLGIETIISPKSVTAGQILKYIRAMAATTETDSIESLSKLVDGKVEALEFNIREPKFYVGKKLCDLKVKNGNLIACIIRDGSTIIPGGSDTIELNDGVVVVTTNSQIVKLIDVFEQ